MNTLFSVDHWLTVLEREVSDVAVSKHHVHLRAAEKIINGMDHYVLPIVDFYERLLVEENEEAAKRAREEDTTYNKNVNPNTHVNYEGGDKGEKHDSGTSSRDNNDTSPQDSEEQQQLPQPPSPLSPSSTTQKLPLLPLHDNSTIKTTDTIIIDTDTFITDNHQVPHYPTAHSTHSEEKEEENKLTVSSATGKEKTTGTKNSKLY